MYPLSNEEMKKSSPVREPTRSADTTHFLLGFCGHGCSLALRVMIEDEGGKDAEDAAHPP